MLTKIVSYDKVIICDLINNSKESSLCGCVDQ